MTKSVFTDRYERLRLLLIDARKSTRLTQTDVADKLHKPQSFVSKYERGERRLDVVEFLDVARVLGLSPCEILRELEREAQP